MGSMFTERSTFVITVRLVLALLVLHAIAIARQDRARVTVTNPAPFARGLETVSIPWNALHNVAPDLNPEAIVVTDNTTRRAVVAQVIDLDLDGKPREIVFQTELKPKERRTFTVGRGAPAQQENRVMVKFMLPRADMAWENDKVAYRIYGGAEAGDVLNGIDMISKRVAGFRLEKWYEEDHRPGALRISYHEDHGEGADFFTVGRSLGAGGAGIWKDGKLHQAGLFSHYRIVANGPIRSVFEVYYPTWNVDSTEYIEVRRFTFDAGLFLNRIEATFIGKDPSASLEIACGLVKRAGTMLTKGEKRGTVSLWGPTNSDPANGNQGTAVVLESTVGSRVVENSAHALIIAKASVSRPFAWYSGGGWSKNAEFPNKEAWELYVKERADKLAAPVVVVISLGK
ncbi:MAG: hypothetical protein A3H45_10115 [Ignavibacteria bacterium RIFCSPLOWO2_02_FULL_55_14]|nr:MAG: hypothetical protein A3H45_10115 [Ignavibacteria bacterium RIFCSPLOWO2_02_FULL_55_14]